MRAEETGEHEMEMEAAIRPTNGIAFAAEITPILAQMQ